MTSPWQPPSPTPAQPDASAAPAAPAMNDADDPRSSAPPSPVGPGRRGVSGRSVLVFAAVAYGVFALCAAPFWVLDGGIAHPLYSLVIGVGMLAPTIASMVVAKLVDRTSWRDAVGLRFRGRWRRILLWAPLGVLLVLGLNLATAVLMVLRGVPGDLTGRTWAAELTRTMAAQGVELPTGAVIALVLAGAAVGLLVTVVPALGEEIGWRGWLRRELGPLGRWPALVLGGTIWSLWHLPVTLIGHNSPDEPRWAAVAMFVPASIALHALFCAITERAGGNPIPAAFAHATLNSTLGLAIGVVATSGTAAGMNWFLDTPLGITGIALVAVVAALIMPRQRRTADRAGGAAEAR